MKNHYAITVSDQSGSRHFTVRKSIKTYFWIFSLFLTAVIATSFGLNYFQFNQNNLLLSENSDLDQELSSTYDMNGMLNQTIQKQQLQVNKISSELVEIERLSGVETGDESLPLEERIRLIGDFYLDKEETYSEIGNRVQQIEGLIGLDNEEVSEEEDLSKRVELASLSASQKKILHDSIPNGYPVDTQVVTSSFGMRTHPITKIKSFHKGVDLRAKNKNKVYSTADGIVREADFSKLSGNRIVVQHNFGFETRYSHLHEMLVSPGDVLHKGDLIGISGNTGRSASPHLHYEVRYLGKAIDPAEFLDWEFGSHEIFTQVRGVKWPSLISLINKQITHQTLQLSQLDPSSLELLK